MLLKVGDIVFKSSLERFRGAIAFSELQNKKVLETSFVLFVVTYILK